MPTLNKGLLPKGYYALAEQQAAGFGPDVFTLQDRIAPSDVTTTTTAVATVRPKTQFVDRSIPTK